jgi:ABC-type multidrug transport system ATPase subunit
MMIDDGKLIGTGYLTDLMESKREITLEIEGSTESFTSALASRGVSVTTSNGVYSVAYDNDEVFDTVRDAAVETGTAIRTLGTRTRSLEEFYIDVVETFEQEQGT